MTNRYAVRTIRLESGERLPLLILKETGIPLLEPTLYALTELRAINRASATIEQAARAVMVLLLFLDEAGIDLASRFKGGQFLEISEIERLVAFCKVPLKELQTPKPWSTSRELPVIKVIRGEGIRRRSPSQKKEVDPRTASIRLFYIHEYLQWLVLSRVAGISVSNPFRLAIENVVRTSLNALRTRSPLAKFRNVGRREGLSEQTTELLLSLIDPGAIRSPWVNEHAKKRNCLAIKMLWSLGVRRGELLGIKISNVDFRKNEILIARRADDPDDSRRTQPNAKTADRILPMSDGLACQIKDYILGPRRAIRSARQHEFLFVANGTGRPLSLIALNKVFVLLRNKFPGLTSTLSPHVLRHTWNDEFSAVMDKRKNAGRH
jgi:integrase